MYDYTFSIPHGVFCLSAGVVGLVRTGNQLYGLELAFGALLLAISVRSLKRFFRGKLSPDGVVIALLIALVNVYLMNEQYAATKLFHPSGLLRIVSCFMAVFYVWNLIWGPAPLDPPPPYNPPKKSQ